VSNIDARVARISAARLIFDFRNSAQRGFIRHHARFQLRSVILVMRDSTGNFAAIKFAAVWHALRCNRAKQVTSS
jgi:hypothetical protein